MAIEIGTQVEIQEEQISAPFNGAVGAVVEIHTDAERPYVVVELCGQLYRFSDMDVRAQG